MYRCVQTAGPSLCICYTYPPVLWPGIFAGSYTDTKNVPAILHECD